ncbi:GntR family transcriptional regulator [Chitinimonas koreensis]|uniref:GntR family transcriptional regulator n=1 Tax=Chitinimonas koreensis TaxID=356302 RepID=UPI00040A1728|nr:GntR family transcriptional regulator [Chitinimonas koreensis]QNM94998.1 GntR family transcriptional regulator [Chitinimonas koreensis]
MAVHRVSTALPARQPLYQQVREHIVAAIEQGEWDAGEALPSEVDLADRLGVSQGTVRKGLDSLVAEGLLLRRQGLGTFVAAVDDDWGKAELPGLARAQDTSVELLACARSHAGEEVAAMLGLRRGAELIVVKRLARVAGEPFALIESFVAAERFEGLDARRIRQANCNLRTVWWREFGLRVLSSPPQFRAGAAGREDARLLGVELDAPLLEVAKSAGTLDGQAIEWSVLRCRTDRYVYRV